MIPYIATTGWALGPLWIQSWGFMVALGILTATFAASRLAKTRGLQSDSIWNLTTWVILGAFVFGRLFHILFYDLSFFMQNPWEVFAIWHGGLSITGGFLGAALVGIIYLKRKRLDVWSFTDTAIFGLPLGLWIGRIGCFLIHDHPGKPTNFFLGVRYPDGIVRHDHGLYLSLNGLLMFLVFLMLAKRKVQTGTYMIVFLIWYGMVRFVLDFYRATEGAIVDERYGHLTPAQYGSVIMIALGIFLAVRMKKYA
ncbi:MAG: Prolipoprotein diacylglyceryl transferase [Candidatus Uhrbacteria bacterium GW2011_GWE2_40_58]|nr:MAG: Prolipoprotein diacylglyceryl transferase [Candidatus Uhrbacteria bacterium GW2011_GWF2_40_263]KKR67965.1 MAG: Prolipoprotein diacylglyceryl transferase [Candidatus Uhrbacteria bacterium GW2011_GWE2_40_58]OGL92411.1 MAG: prolipoprotein diacylglyceryl transferase [Candidatus Uhrbacteria bacterium RIFOXYA2_FULL_40_9]OGL97002.1 MAG: prolipoprotein diacylglyceryl transferase [Candidatus Uhrbacteria bacterium RIFOXYB2_FULL_41_18]HBK34760.1 prolipoprotein diacylglyceryl transferase [Candidatu